MSAKARLTISDDYVQGQECAICRSSSLDVVHLDGFPDYVACAQCGSAFVMEVEGPRVMFGNIAAEYPETGRFVLREWATLETVRRHAMLEHPPPGSSPYTPLPHLDASEEEEASREPFEESLPETHALPTSPEDAIADLTAAPEQAVEASDTPEEPLPEVIALPASHDHAITDPVPAFEEAESGMQEPPAALAVSTATEQPDSDAVGEDVSPETESEEDQIPPGPSLERRYRVRIKGDQADFPQDICAHCMGSPVRGILEVHGVVAGGEEADTQRKEILHIPLCPECGRIASASSSARKDSILLAHLVSLIVGLLLIVVGILLRLIDFSRDLPQGLLVLAGMGLVGYLIPLALLLPRAKRNPTHQEVTFVRSTLRVSGDPERPQETTFDWRNPAYAALFLELNRNRALGEITDE